MIFPFKITVYDYHKEIKSIDLFYMDRCGICFEALSIAGI